jgi:hypothetical protein
MTNKPHKFFEKYLNNDLEKMSDYLLDIYKKIENVELRGITKIDSKKDHWLQSQSASTVKWTEYNVFQFYNDEIYNLYNGVRDTLKEACDYYEINYKDQKYMIQGWFNINYNKRGKLDWHDHGPKYGDTNTMNFHGYYCVKAEPSVTHYKINNGTPFENINKNNRLILSEMGHPHAMADWEWDGPRITVAYDIISLNDLSQNNKANAQHWFPM